MNVLYLTINPNRESTTVPTEGWFRCLEASGLRPVLASSACGAFQNWAESEGIPSYQVPLLNPSKSNPLPFIKSLWQLRRIVRRHAIELIHCNEQDCYPIGSYLARIAGLPIVVSVHFTMERGFCKWAFGGRRCPDRMYFVSKRNFEQCFNGLDGIVARDNCRVLHNGLNLERYQVDARVREDFRKEHRLEHSVALGVACALRPRKQLEHFFAAAAKLNFPNLKFVLAGGPVTGDEEYARSILEKGRDLLGTRFVYIGHVKDLRPLCNGLDLFVNTSREESFGIAVLEALACGCPVIGYDSKAVDEVILPDGGEIVPQDNIESLAAGIDKWLRHSDKLNAARRGARQQAERFDIRHISNQLWQGYEDVLSLRRTDRFVEEAGAIDQTKCVAAD